jgi:lipopolysaccharide/colanic/teichoic acid biosynthesis glycosyltransferase
LTSEGPVIYAQERCGLNGRRFRCWKFRSMRLGADRGSLMTHKGDRRITSVGRSLRTFKLDELPQLANVLVGDMSIVGPRPQAGPHVEMCGVSFVRVLAVRPGLTSPATIQFRHEEWLLDTIPDAQRDSFYRTLMEQKIRLNLEYIERASFVYDLRLIAETMAVLLRTRNRKSLTFLRTSVGLPEA